MSNSPQPSFEQFALIIEDKLKIPREQVQPETVLKDVEIDSISVIEVMLAAEKQFGAPIPMDDVDVDGTAEDLYQLVVAAVGVGQQ
ncbi:MAG TPA: acyl carrier protein [Trebonia sp.]